MTNRRRSESKKPDPFWTFFKGAMGIMLAIVVAVTILAGGCCGVLIGVADSIEEQKQEGR
jgi:hypothetical protein